MISLVFRTLQNENKKYETIISEITKKTKDEKHRIDETHKDLEIEEDKEKDMEIMLKEEEYLNEKLYNVRQRMTETDNENFNMN